MPAVVRNVVLKGCGGVDKPLESSIMTSNKVNTISQAKCEVVFCRIVSTILER